MPADIYKLVDTNQDIVKAFIVEVSSDLGSNQLKDPFDEALRQNIYKTIVPPFDPYFWANLLELNTRLNKGIRIYARNTVGLGCYVEKDKDIPEDKKQWVDSVYLKLDSLFKEPNDDMPFNTIMELEKIDQKATGTGYIEVTRNLSDEIAHIFHIPGVTVRMCEGGEMYAQLTESSLKYTYFKKFNDPRQLNKHTGEFSKKGEQISPLDRASELINFKEYTPQSTYYGAPPHSACAPSIIGNRQVGERNTTFLKNSSGVTFAVIVNNGHLDAKSVEDVRTFIDRQAKNVQQAGKALILQAESGKRPGSKEASANITISQFDKQLEASFQGFRKSNDEEIREALGLAQICYGTTTDLTKDVAAVSWATTVDQEFIPEIVNTEYKINHTIVKSFGCPYVHFRFIRPEKTNPTDEAGIIAKIQPDSCLLPKEKRAWLEKVTSMDCPPLDPIKYPWVEERFFNRGKDKETNAPVSDQNPAGENT